MTNTLTITHYPNTIHFHLQHHTSNTYIYFQTPTLEEGYNTISSYSNYSIIENTP